MQADVYTILCFSEISLPRDDILSDLIILTSPHERSEDPTPIFFEVIMQATTPRTLVDGKTDF